MIRLISRAARAGAELIVKDGAVHVRGLEDPELLTQLRAHKAAITGLLTSPSCAGCDAEPWIHEADTSIPWCRPCANHRGLQLLRHERPDLLEELPCAS